MLPKCNSCDFQAATENTATARKRLQNNPSEEKTRKQTQEEVRASRVPLQQHSLHPFKYLFKCTLSHRRTNLLSLLFHFCPTSITSTPKMIICLRQIILRKAIYRITIPLLYPQSQTSSLECVFLRLCTQYTAYLFLLANMHMYTHAPRPFCQTFRIAICFQECICIIVWYHWTPVSLHSFFQSTNMYILFQISMEPKMPALLSNIWAEGFPLKIFI